MKRRHQTRPTFSTISSIPAKRLTPAACAAGTLRVITLTSLASIAAAAQASAPRATDVEAAAEAAKAAVEAAYAVTAPDASKIISDSNLQEGLEAFGGGDISKVESQRDLWADGKGTLYGPAVERVVGCRNASDPECLAVQQLDRGFPERPVIPDDVVAGKDEAIGGITVETPGTGAGVEDCRSFTITTDPIDETKTCRSGGWYEPASCRFGWLVTPGDPRSTWACRRYEALRETLACRIPASLETKPETIERCFINADALAPVRNVEETTTALASAVFPASCEATLVVEEEASCEQVLSVEAVPGSCRVGAETTSTTSGSPALFSDGCPGADTLEVTTFCENVRLDMQRSVRIRLNGSYAPVTISGRRTKEIASTDSPCRARLTVKSHTCSQKVNCLVQIEAEIYERTTFDDLKGTISVYHPYTGYDASAASEVDTWTDGCSALSTDEAFVPREGGR